MSELTVMLGKRLRQARLERGLSQEKLSELAGVHPTYIGQIERGEKNLTVDSLEKVADALGLTLEQVFEKLGNRFVPPSPPILAYQLLAERSVKEQEQLLHLLRELIQWKDGKRPG